MRRPAWSSRGSWGGASAPGVAQLEGVACVDGVARDLVERQVSAWGVTALGNDLVAVAAELVGNAVAASPDDRTIKVSLRWESSGLVAAVWDASNERLKPRSVELTLDVIDALPDDHEFGGWDCRSSSTCATTAG